MWGRNSDDGKSKLTNQPQAGNQLVRTEDGVTTDLRASVQIMDTIVTPEAIEKDVREIFGADREIKSPDISDSALNINNVNTPQGIAAYLQSNINLIEDYNSKVDLFMEKVYTDSISADELDSAQKETEEIVKKLYVMPVPRDAVRLHKAMINVYAANVDLIKEAKVYQKNATDETWKEVYYNYAVINDAILKMNDHYKILKQKYAITVK
jgi:hypothetical protein